jgi:signal peptidase I
MEILDFFKEIFQTVILALLIVLPIRLFIFQPFIVKGQSMEPNFKDGNYLIIDELSYKFREPKRGEVIVFKNPKNPSQKFIKRVIGLPGEKVLIEDGKITIFRGEKSQVLDESSYLNFPWTGGNLEVSLGENEYFVLGDNRSHSFDSRYFGPLPKNYIIGRVLLSLWPPTVSLAKIKIETPTY